MHFALTKAFLGYGHFVDISKEEYQAIGASKKNLIEALYLEQKLDMVVEDYFEFEMELLATSTRQMVQRNQDYYWFQEEINRLNRRIVNLLSACRLYLDQSIHHLSCIYGKGAEKLNNVRKKISKEYDSKLGYRVMEAMRNYVQHRGFPVHKWTFHTKRVERKGKSQVLFTLAPFIDVQELRQDKKFKKEVVEELEKIGNEIDIKPFVREYVAGIGNAHEYIRSVICEDVLKWEKQIIACIVSAGVEMI
jgi:hypothetical protein